MHSTHAHVMRGLKIAGLVLEHGGAGCVDTVRAKHLLKTPARRGLGDVTGVLHPVKRIKYSVQTTGF